MNRRSFTWMLLALLVVSSCSTIGRQRPTVDVRGAQRDSRIVISPVPFYLREAQGLAVMQPDERFASIVVSTLEMYLQEKGHAAFFAGTNPGLLTQPEVGFLFTADSRKLVEQRTQKTNSFDPGDSKTPPFEKVGKILFPVVVVKKVAGLMGLGYLFGTLDMTFHAFLVDTRTGQLLWSNQIQKIGDYNQIDLELRGLRWGHGAMWDLLATFK